MFAQKTYHYIKITEYQMISTQQQILHSLWMFNLSTPGLKSYKGFFHTVLFINYKPRNHEHSVISIKCNILLVPYTLRTFCSWEHMYYSESRDFSVIATTINKYSWWLWMRLYYRGSRCSKNFIREGHRTNHRTRQHGFKGSTAPAFLQWGSSLPHFMHILTFAHFS